MWIKWRLSYLISQINREGTNEMIINHAKHALQIHSRIDVDVKTDAAISDVHVNRDDYNGPEIQFTIIKDGWPVAKTVRMTRSQASEFAKTLMRLADADYGEATETPIAQLHPRAEQLLRDANQHELWEGGEL
jgi:hypothetical protein